MVSNQLHNRGLMLLGGIAGIYHLDGRPVDRADLERLNQALAHRGPDGRDLWHQGPIGLAHQMLWTTPESRREKVPMVNRTGDLVIAADARIDNREELIHLLGLEGHGPGEITDSALIMAAYERWGEDCPPRLVGDFAWAIWDGRRQTLFAVRDHFGVNPFYYYLERGRSLAFASEIQALLTLPGVPRRLNEVRVADHLMPRFDDTASTFYQGILRLPPAHCLRWGREGLSLRPYWSLDPGRELPCTSPGDYAEGFRSHFFEAVRCRLRSAFPVGVMLSGGLDSSAVTCTARHLLTPGNGARLHTFSAIFDSVPESDERPFIKAVLAQGDLEPHYLHGDALSPLGDQTGPFAHEDEPVSSPNLFLQWGLTKAAQQQGVRVLLNGSPGDATVSHGLEYLPELAVTGKWLTLLRELQELPDKFQLYRRRSPWHFFRNQTLRPLVPDWLFEIYRQRLKGLGPAWNREGLIRPEFAQRLRLNERYHTLSKEKKLLWPTARASHFQNMTSGILSSILTESSRAASRLGVEPRYPFFDKRLAEYCLALPADQKLRQGWTRYIMRRSLEAYMPAEVCWRRTKASMRPNFTRGMVKLARHRLDQIVRQDAEVIGEYVDLAKLGAAYQRYVCQGSVAYEMAVWRAATLAMWLQQTGLSP